MSILTFMLFKKFLTSSMVISFISVYGIFYDAKVRINNVETKYFKGKQPFGLLFKFKRQNNPPYGVNCVRGEERRFGNLEL